LSGYGEGRPFFLFFREKKRKNQRKETLTDKENRGGLTRPLPCYQLTFFWSFSFQKEKDEGRPFFLFFREKKRKNQRKETSTDKENRGGLTRPLPYYPLTFF
jgi:hypothetical protein